MGIHFYKREMATIGNVVTKFVEEYSSKTPRKLKIIDAYLTYIFFTGVFQFLYCCLVSIHNTKIKPENLRCKSGWHFPIQCFPLWLHLIRCLLHPRCLPPPPGESGQQVPVLV